MGIVITSKYDIFVSHQFDYFYLEKVADIHSPMYLSRGISSLGSCNVLLSWAWHPEWGVRIQYQLPPEYNLPMPTLRFPSHRFRMLPQPLGSSDFSVPGPLLSPYQMGCNENLHCWPGVFSAPNRKDHPTRNTATCQILNIRQQIKVVMVSAIR